jgi:propane monooxygenase small subunit
MEVGNMSKNELTIKSAEAGSKKFAGSNSRKYNYFEPKGKRATLYENITVDVQPDPDRYLIQGWIISFPDGTPAYSDKWTKIKSSNWHEFRDPNGEWERTHYIRVAGIEKQINLTIQNAKVEDSFQNMDKGWVKVLQDHLSASKHAEYGLGMLFQSAQRDGMSQMINNAILINSSDKLRYAQDVAIYIMNIANEIELDEAVGKENWLKKNEWQGAREVVETFTASTDWAEQVFAANLIYEPLVNELFRSGFLMQYAASHGDFVTPTIVATAEGDFERNLDYTLEMFHTFFSDPEHGQHNKQVAQEWINKYLPMCVKAARQLQPIWSQPRVKVTTFPDQYKKAEERFNTILNALNLELPKGVTI